MARPIAVVIEIAQNAPVTRVLAVNGRIAPVNSVEVGAVVSGTLVAFPMAEGDRVETGQILAEVDAAAQNAIARQAMAALDAALVAQQKATEDFNRSVALGSTVPRTDRATNASAMQSAIQEVARLTASLDQAQIARDSYTIRAPIAGTVLQLDAEMGQTISPSTRLLTLADLSELRVEVNVDEAYATQIALGQSSVLQGAGQTAIHQGHISFVANRVNAATGGLAVRIKLDTPLAAPIGHAAIKIIIDERDGALTVSRTTIMDGEKVFVLVDGGADLLPVTAVNWPAARLIATVGLAEGDVVIADATGIPDGQNVTPEQP
ncbi:efflux RND transporter periplasmic adaptor subunit [Salipiger sp. 1_MG-2023]|uniref:efflux RND transporter periplasmic adaptor subunit n=1 Tax=Salipiger sp. 1_MG-2023 TaxID=3062665 RepID=UPI0026E261FD|nr:efflux RND transporter periplasmic adaptor subunit [Salipiger sp. 1_MG-2023]MDO6588569.1 efflux RND transporter periplasmic adaptor subunit [Salipiger sp. 1_MG-2023]